MADAGIVYGKDVEKIKNDFREILSEIDSITQGSYREKDILEKIRDMIDINRIERLSQMLDSMEKKAREADERAISAFRDMEKYRKDLEMERIRLEKLWDAYKKQEDDITTERKTAEEWKNKLAEQEAAVEELKKKVEALKELEEDREKVEKLAGELKEYRAENEKLKLELERERASKANLEKEVEELSAYLPYKKEAEMLRKRVEELEPLKDYIAYKKKYDEVEKLYKKEQERLAKLYKVYEDLNRELKEAREKLEGWESWFRSNSEYVEKAAYAFSKFKQPEGLTE
ncbi:MAG TPA: hypothetical protein ENL18_00265 [Thermoplasmatales archaeon]|nr:hypothetical protein [Thermoplasmatales archaeon]